MKTGSILLLSALGLLLLLVPAGATCYMSENQDFDFTTTGELYWAMIWDYTNNKKESSTTGFIDIDHTLTYQQSAYGEVHVAYLYDWSMSRYVEAQALRNISMW